MDESKRKRPFATLYLSPSQTTQWGFATRKKSTSLSSRFIVPLGRTIIYSRPSCALRLRNRRRRGPRSVSSKNLAVLSSVHATPYAALYCLRSPVACGFFAENCKKLETELTSEITTFMPRPPTDWWTASAAAPLSPLFSEHTYFW